MNKIKSSFPLLKKNLNLVYLDNAATTQKPNAMIYGLSEYYSEYNSNIGRGLYDLAQKSQECYDQSKIIVSKFFGTYEQNIIYTSGSTESLNLACYIASQHINKKYIILPISEHHANILIWQELAIKFNLEIFWVEESELIENPSRINQNILENSAIFAISHVSNVTGEVFPIKKWCDVANKYNAISVIDGSQAVGSILINITELNCDFYAFSSHKLYGPMGLGVLFIKNKYLNSKPLKLGGGIIEDVDKISSTLVDSPNRFEAGTPNVANAYAFSKTLEFLIKNNWSKLLINNHNLGNYLKKELSNIGISQLEINNSFQKTHISSFVIPNVHSHDVGTFLASKNIAVRVGKHCAYPLHKHLNVNSTIRASIGIYNTKKDIDLLIINILKCIEYFKG